MSDQGPRRLPGDRRPTEEIARMLRVDHAGEYGATRIYQGQLDVLGRSRAAGEIRRMAETEKGHLARFEELLHERRVRPTLLSPLWTVAGYALGAVGDRDFTMRQLVVAKGQDRLSQRRICFSEILGLPLVMLIDGVLDRDRAGHRRTLAEECGRGT